MDLTFKNLLPILAACDWLWMVRRHGALYGTSMDPSRPAWPSREAFEQNRLTLTRGVRGMALLSSTPRTCWPLPVRAGSRIYLFVAARRNMIYER